MPENIDDEVSLAELFKSSQQLITDIEAGSYTSQSLQPKVKTEISNLEKLTLLVNKLALFSSNELIDDIPTDSLQYLKVPCFLGLFHQSLIVEPKEKLDALRKAKIYYRNYLERLRNLTLFEKNLYWEDDEEESSNGVPKGKTKIVPEEARRLKLEQHRRKKELKETEARIQKQLEAVSIDDGNLRDLYLTQLRYWVERSFEELQSIEEELPLLKMMAERTAPPPPRQPTKAPIKPFVLTRDAQQKAVFGLGYPSVPTLTVDEWYHQRFGCNGGPAAAQQQPQSSQQGAHEESEEEDDDEKRAKEMRWDEYKDDHRRGWGNTHNKG